ncbi:MAG: hypothetical protein CO088_03115 [Candidatus Yonathbacteria bacterium CG_4_9_14_0_8_um_filter_46_47]|uniref:Uncharacterized protein n=1 Tax=Candidatus Yonathbacteria bacterium CG_4_9_14_0_8_um_filter_46_47 TaxID=1975106 RepID=A0A2M8D6K6_9BACT|nr:MAG: hypothetical protein CO088_03115 [Candidatus Yonathbacteria bacterium CG_4_9_14_0_8_um_filter_46_47]PJC20175.1 MAG: hypothetical protein CO061_03260 [Candidatus Yonathbacteria bacterium CG_4_9_14_0_2_um_filter_47_74]
MYKNAQNNICPTTGIRRLYAILRDQKLMLAFEGKHIKMAFRHPKKYAQFLQSGVQWALLHSQSSEK